MPNRAVLNRSADTNPQWVLVERDYAIVDWVNRHGVVTVDLIARKFFPGAADRRGNTAAYRRVQKLVDLGYLTRRRVKLGVPDAVTATRSGARLVDSELDALPSIPHDLDHALDVVRLLIEIEKLHPDERLITEREWRRHLHYRFKSGEREVGHGRIPDAVLEYSDGRQIAIERERARKRDPKIAEILREYFHERFHRVWWFCPSYAASERLKSVAYQMAADDWIEVFVLE